MNLRKNFFYFIKLVEREREVIYTTIKGASPVWGGHVIGSKISLNPKFK